MGITLPGLAPITATPALLASTGRPFVLPPPDGGGGSPPSITGFTPSEGPVDTAVTITGTYFLTTARVLFNGVASTNWKINSDSQITAHVPDGASSGRIEVAAGGGNAYTGAGFTVTQPQGGGGGGGSDLTGCVAPCRNDLQYLRNDQGLDVVSKHDFLALKAGTVGKFSHGWSGGTGIGLYLTFDEPVKVLGTTYKQQYIAEGKPIVSEGDHVRAGKHLVQPASVEFGFWPSPLVGGKGAGSQPTQQSYDWAWTLRQLGIDVPDSALGPNLGKGGGGGGGGPGPGPQPGQGVQSAWDDVLHVYSRKVPKMHDTLADFDQVLIGVFK